jgi:glycosyltransferase involved in cell wall biosynthesis
MPPVIGGITRWIQGILDSQVAEEFDIEIFDTSPPDVEAVGGGSRFKIRRAVASLVMLVRIATILGRRRPLLVHINTSYHWAFSRDGLMVWLAAALGARTVLHLHGGDFDHFFRSCSGGFQWFVRRTLRKVDAIIPITRDTEEFLRRSVDTAKIFYLPNFVSPELFASNVGGADAGNGSEPTGPIEVLFIGWIIEEKGVIELLDAARTTSGMHFTLVGPFEPDFLARIEGSLRDLGDSVTLVGPLPHSDVIDLYKRSDVFVLPSHREGFPNVILEAMAAGLPVISTPVGAIPEIVRDGVDGFLVPVGATAALEDRFEHLANDASHRLQMGASGRERVRGQFALATVALRLAELYRVLIRPVEAR